MTTVAISPVSSEGLDMTTVAILPVSDASGERIYRAIAFGTSKADRR
jgi:hypothetical protein